MESADTEIPEVERKPTNVLAGWRWVWFVLACHTVSLLLAYMSAFTFGDRIGPGAGYPRENPYKHILYRFDSEYYQDIAEYGYSYDGNPASSPNIVFAPIYPLETRFLAKLSPLSFANAGFWVSRLDFLAALVLLFLAIRAWFGERAAIFSILGLCFSAGTWAFHAYYSESTMLAWLGAAFYCLHRRWHWPLAISAFVLSATRTTAGPFCLVLAVWFLACAWREFQRPERDWKVITTRVVQAPLCLGGLCVFLAFIWFRFGNPFVLLPEIQETSWGKFHQPVAWWEVIIVKHMFIHGVALFQRGFADIRNINYVYTLLAIVSGVYGMFRFKNHVFKWGFGGYVLLIYKMNAGSEWLISTHRFFAMMLPIFLMVSDLHGWLQSKTNRYVAASVSTLIFLISAAYYVVCVTHFVMGHWYYF